ncbi:translation initiation factor eIF 4e-like domain-containing protein [Roridomyces roridus]|uniref:Translation initiation factor eIF 4e-like domain-containing protein n=1 Tax=Roridomyces roridus TaxID=1738132 RepID=A0AAD7BEH9_9AGAR|nr:translation initiation factor eIF 4e-like domain-containing protein [Roridomyces roridus]
MSGSTPYFSNHSQPQSRFLAISGLSSTAPASTAVAAPSSTPATHPTRPRSTSKHFSTSIPSSGDEEKGPVDGDAGTPSVRVSPLRNTWVFWFRQQRAPGNKIVNYEEGIKRVAAFSSVESFWSLHTHLVPPSALTPTTDYLLFHAGVGRPVWEDPLNIGGGKWILRLKKGVADRVWETLLCAVVGDKFPDSSPDASDPPEICGCTISVRQSEDIISVWNRVEADVRVRERIRDTLRTVLGLPTGTVMEYKSNNDSMQDKSSFRTMPVAAER